MHLMSSVLEEEMNGATPDTPTSHDDIPDLQTKSNSEHPISSTEVTKGFKELGESFAVQTNNESPPGVSTEEGQRNGEVHEIRYANLSYGLTKYSLVNRNRYRLIWSHRSQLKVINKFQLSPKCQVRKKKRWIKMDPWLWAKQRDRTINIFVHRGNNILNIFGS